MVTIGLQAADKPGARIGKSFVVQVHRVLGGQNDAEPEGAGLFEQGEERCFGWRVFDRREIPENFVHVQDGPQAGCSRKENETMRYL